MIKCDFRGSFGDRLLFESDWRSIEEAYDEKKKGKFKRWFKTIDVEFMDIEKVDVLKNIDCRYQFIVILHSDDTVYQLAYRYAKNDIRTVDIFISTIDEEVVHDKILIDVPGIVFIATLLFLSYLLDPYG